MPRVVAVRALEPFNLWLRFSDGREGVVVLDELFSSGGVFEPLRDPAEWTNPNMVKVVSDARGFAMYFSRAPIPHGRDASSWQQARIHIGLYVYRRATLLRLAALRPSRLERLEALEQLRALENGIGIRVIDTHYHSAEVNTPEDLQKVRQAYGELHAKASH